jgi:hypothetical protein
MERDGEVTAERTVSLEAEDGVELKVLWQRPVDIGQAVSWQGKAGVMLFEVATLQEVVGCPNGRDPFAPEGLDESVLVCAVAPFDTPFGLWRVGKDLAYTQGLHCPSEIGQDAILGEKDCPTVTIETSGDAISLTVGAEGSQTVSRVLRGRKAEKDPPRGVIDQVEQCTGRSASLKPIMV